MPRPKKQPAPALGPSVEDKDAIARLDNLVLSCEEETGDIQDNGLTLRQQAFVIAITGPAFMNQVKAAEMAGYNGANRQNLHLCANRNLNTPHIARAIRLTLAKKFREDPDWLDNEAYALATTTMNDFVKVDEHGKVTVDFAKAIQTGAIAAAKDIKFDPETGACIDIKLHDRVSAMEFYAKLTGRMKGDKPEDGSPSTINLNITLVRDVPRKELPPVITNPIGDVHVENEEPPGLRITGPGTADGQ